MTKQSAEERELPGRRYISLFDAHRTWDTLELPARRNWPLFALCAGLAPALLTKASFDIVGLVRYSAVRSVDLPGLMTGGFATFIWLFFGVLAFVVALIIALRKEEFRSGDGLLVHVMRIGPLRYLTELNLALVRDVRTTGHGTNGDSQIYFEYGDVTMPFGRPQPGQSADLGVEFIQQAMGSRSDKPPTGVASLVHIARGPAWLPIAFLVGANLVPVVGVLALGWDLGQIVVLFWAESIVIGFYAWVKIIIVQRLAAVFIGPFFFVHFGGFMAIDFVFVYHYFVAGAKGGELDSAAFLALFSPLWTAVLAMFVSHGVSFFSEFLRGVEDDQRNLLSQMLEPYKRVVLLHVVIFAGGFAVAGLGAPVSALLVMVAVKIALDLHAHVRGRRGTIINSKREVINMG